MGEKTKEAKGTNAMLHHAIPVSTSSAPQLTVYSLEFCPNCETLKDYLKSRGIPFIEKDMSSREPLAELRLHGVFAREAPVLRRGERFLTSGELFSSGRVREERIQELVSGE
ncbi:MAG: glutaredoxin family protein [Methanomicrobiales archaeon]|nr:glutaredoxin family protein [Methanomicrobiales archaeon]MDI6875203.1 glutaredoxin family protein [Methanomicrobiales archaeon]